MIFSRGWVLCVLLTVGGFVQPLLAGVYGPDPCSICGQAITGTIYLGTDKTTGEKKMVCGTCVRLPDCIICSLPVGAGGIQLADGRHLCARDAKTVVLKASEVERISFQVRDELDRLFSRFAEFPKQVEVSAIDRIDVDDMFHPDGNDFESPNLLGCIKTEEVEGVKHFKMRVMTGLPLTELKATCAHELSHGWVGENVVRSQRAPLGRDAEEGFCEMVSYLLMESQHSEEEQKRILKNRYTRGQVDLFIEAEKRYGFDQIMDWMKYGTTAQLEPGHVDAIREVKMPQARTVATATAGPRPASGTNRPAPAPAPVPAPAPATIKLQGIMWGAAPTAVINGRSFGVNETRPVKVGTNEVVLHCLAIQPDSVRLQNQTSGEQLELRLMAK